MKGFEKGSYKLPSESELANERLMREFAQTGDYELIKDRPDIQKRLGVGSSSEDTQRRWDGEDGVWAEKNGYLMFETPGISVISSVKALCDAGYAVPVPKQEQMGELVDFLVGLLRQGFIEPHGDMSDYMTEIKAIFYYALQRWPHQTSYAFMYKLYGWGDDQLFLIDLFEDALVKMDADAEMVENGGFQGKNMYEYQDLCENALHIAFNEIQTFLQIVKRDPGSRYIVIAKLEALQSEIHERVVGDTKAFKLFGNTWAVFTENYERLKMASSKEIAEWSGGQFTQEQLENHMVSNSTSDIVFDIQDILLDSGHELEEYLQDSDRRNPWLAGRLKSCLRTSSRVVLERDFYFHFSQLKTPRELAYFLDYATRTALYDQQELRARNKYLGSDFMRTFLICSADAKASSEIMRFAAEAPHKQALAVFRAFGEFADEVANLDEYLAVEFGVEDADAVSAVSDKLLARARELLRQANTYANEPEKLEQLLKSRTAKGQMFLSLYRALKEMNAINTMADLEGVRYEEVPAEVLEDSPILTQATLMYEKNHPEVAGELLKEFSEKLRLPGASLHYIHFGNPEKLVAFMLLVPLLGKTKEVEVSGLNVDRELVGAKPGVELLEKLMNMVRVEGITIHATAVEALALQYEKQYGFRREGEAPTRADGQKRFKIRLDPSQQQ